MIHKPRCPKCGRIMPVTFTSSARPGADGQVLMPGARAHIYCRSCQQTFTWEGEEKAPEPGKVR